MFFFFQAEDGIRDLVRSRGLGDVYKRQAFVVDDQIGVSTVGRNLHKRCALVGGDFNDAPIPVSYTHLTLPTSDLV